MKNYIIIGFVSILLVVMVFLIAKKANAKPNKIVVPEDLNTDAIDTKGNSGTGTSKKTSYDPTDITDRLYNEIKGWNFTYDDKLYSELMSLSNTNLVKVMNDWDKRYFKKWNETLLEAIEGEKIFGFYKNSILSRLREMEKLRKK